MLEIKDLSLSYGKEAILKEINLSSSSSHLGIIGTSGSGKSSLLKSLIALFSLKYSLKAEKLRVFGEEVLSLKTKSLQDFRRKVSYIPADIYGSFYPLSDIGSVFENVLSYHSMFSRSTRKKRAFEVMERLGLKDLDLIWHSYIRELSGGMARRVQIALSLVCGAEYLLCDEITSSLDSKNTQKLLEFLEECQIPFVLVTHDLDILKIYCDEVIVMSDGVILEKSATFFTSPQNTYSQSLIKAYECLK